MEAQELKCVATQTGYYENIIKEDEEFVLKDHRLFSENWMRPKRDDAKSKKLIAEAAEWVFNPAKRNDEPVAAWTTYTIRM